ncbi:MAG TPA: hypothetical protein VMC03_21910 [Streptosporangiaceae bacterium]|nr:hypothetical protein [Streptosporangiaceae bacterium]
MTSWGPATVSGAVIADVGPAPGRVPWTTRRAFPLLATAALIVVSMGSTTWWGPLITGNHGWVVPDDLWGTLAAADRLAHIDIAGLYTRSTGLVGFPGAAVILVPVAALIDAVGMSLRLPGAHNLHPAVWLLAGPYEMAISAVVLFAADALGERLGADRSKRAVLTAASAMALWCVSVEWGHPEDAVGVGLLLYAVLALSLRKAPRSAWLMGAAIAVQPVVLITLPLILVALEPRRVAGYLVRAATPAVVLLGTAAAANWPATVHAVANQPNWPRVDHPTPWTSLAPHLSGGAVAAGPFRLMAIGVAFVAALILGRHFSQGRGRAWSRQTLQEFLWWTALALALRSVFEPVMVAYYLWPVLAVAVIAAVRHWSRLAATSVLVTVITFASQVSLRGPWAWYAVMVAGLAVTLFLARLPRRLARPPRCLARIPQRLGRHRFSPARPGT